MDMDQVLEPKLVNKLTELLGILSKKDALTIFLLSKDGLKAEADTPQKIGLTRKQYYTRLKQLVDNGLIDKAGDVYMHTTLGTFVYKKHLLEMLGHVRNAKQMEMVDTLKRTKQFSEDDITDFVGKITGASLQTSVIPQVRFSTSYEQMVSDVIEQIQFCKSEILLASRFQNDLIINNLLRKAGSGVNVKLIVDKEIIRNYARNTEEKLRVNDRNSIERLMVALNPHYPVAPNMIRKLSNIPFCVLIIDRERVGVEIIDRLESDKFKYVFFVKDKAFAEEVRKIFETFWTNAEEDNVGTLQKILEEVITSK
jgi:predicted transcriptional regulator